MNIINGELFLRYGTMPLETDKYSFPDIYHGNYRSKIYQIAISEKGAFYRTRNNNGELSDFRKTSFEKIDKGLIPLSDYLLDADYLGLPASVNCIDQNHNQQIINGVILYRNPAFLLVYDMEPSNLAGKTLPLRVINSDDFLSYSVTGTKTNIYSDPKELYHDLFIEILETTRDMNNKGRQK